MLEFFLSLLLTYIYQIVDIHLCLTYYNHSYIFIPKRFGTRKSLGIISRSNRRLGSDIFSSIRTNYRYCNC